ncbi:MAG TPA: alpha/beta hydrolase-fold protein [Pyrinomonadaceae bacterium]|jgi:S-formylglutathione hydrolase FrmB
MNHYPKFRLNKFVAFLLFFSFFSIAAAIKVKAQATALQFETTIARGLVSAPQKGRLFVFLNRSGEREPRFADYDDTSLNAPPILAKDVENFAPASTRVVIDNGTITYPIKNLAELAAGDYYVQALLDINNDLRSLNAPGNLYSAVQKINLDTKRGGVIKLELTKTVPPEQMPADTDYVKFLKIQSPLLSKFYGRPIFVRAGVVLPRDYERDTTRRYPLLIRIGGYGTKFNVAQGAMSEKSNFRKTWLADDTPRMIAVFLDGDGPYGDSYQINSANSGPYGDSLTEELIPAIEKQFRAAGKPEARFLTGGSTGGWVSLALQIFYPDYFNGTWSGFPDPLDFRAYQLVNIYTDENAYVNKNGFERPSAREANGDTEFTMRLECQKENVLGAGDSYTMSGGQWGAWNATYSTRGADGRPVPLWDAKTGKINREVAKQWEKYDLRLVVERNWQTLAPRLKGKLHIWVGEADDYFLNNGVHFFDDFMTKAEPKYDGWIMYNRTGRHGWTPKSSAELMKEMMQKFESASK